jgi:3-hydroxyacyl-CoA dehydrogenase
VNAPVPAVAVVGAGSIGVAWAITFARAGCPVSLYDVSADRVAVAVSEIESRLVELADFELISEPVSAVLARVRVAADLPSAVDGVGYVQECVVESLAVKQELFASLDALAGPEVVLASSTSMIPCSRFAAELAGRSRCLVVHPGNPPYLLPIAELAPAPFTAPATVELARSVLTLVGMVPVLVGKENEGFIFNRLQGALLREAYCLVRDGIAAPADVDRVVSAGLGRRWAVLGPFATAELNTRGGIERHASLLGPAYARMGAERGQDDPWTPELVRRVADAVHVELPEDEWAEHVARRDRALMLLERARQSLSRQRHPGQDRSDPVPPRTNP